MDSNRFRITLYFILFVSTFYLWQQWTIQHLPKPTATDDKGNVVQAVSSTNSEVMLKHGRTVPVKTELVSADVDTYGGDIRNLYLLKYGSLENKNKPFQVLDAGKDHIYLAQSGFFNDNGTPPSLKLPEHSDLFALDGSPQVSKVGTTITLVAKFPTAEVRKKLTFHNDSYLIDVTYEVRNLTNKVLTPTAYFKLLRDGKDAATSTRGSSFTGPALFTDAEKYHKVAFSKLNSSNKDDNSINQRVNDGWVAMVQHYFTSAWLLNQPPMNGETTSVCQKRTCTVDIEKSPVPLEVNGKVFNDTYSAAVFVAMDSIAPGQTGSITLPLFVGPEDHQVFDSSSLHDLAPDLYLTKDYGWQRIIAEPLFLVLVFLHKLVSNWGVAIVCLTLLIKAVFFPLSRASYKSMAKMKKLMPRMQELKEIHGEDKLKYQQAVMALYKSENANPMGGCLPILIQIPVFLALYSVLQSAVELRQAPFFGWIQDLSLADPYYVLPVILAVTMYAQTLLNPPPTDPVQAKMMKVMPLVFSIMFFMLPVGLVVYYIVNNLLSILQQWYVNRQLEV